MMNNNSSQQDIDKLLEAEQFYDSFTIFAKSLFDNVIKTKTLDNKVVFNKIKTAYNFIHQNHRYIMRVKYPVDNENDNNYIVSHLVRTTIIAMIIGMNMKFPAHRLIELGTAALLHDVGMLSFPQEFYLKRHPLTDQEKLVLRIHPEQGYKLLAVNGFPQAVIDAVIEHHERENGTGYPRNLKKDEICLYAKIIAVACSYEAISAERLHKAPRDQHEGIVELLKNEGKQYNEQVLRALVYSLSVYPLGLYVLLSDGQKGQVVDIDPFNPRYPVVQLLDINSDNNSVNKKNRLVYTSPIGVFIVRPLKNGEL